MGDSFVAIQQDASPDRYIDAEQIVISGDQRWRQRVSSIIGQASDHPDRTHVQVCQTATTATTTLYTVPAGKRLYVTTLGLSAYNSSSINAGDLQVIDSTDNTGAAQVALALPTAVTGAASPGTGREYPFGPEPLQFADAVRVRIVAGTVTYACSFVGYREPV